MADPKKPEPLRPAEASFLNPDERQQLQRFLGFPEEFPRKFGSWIADYIAVNGLEIPASQIRGINSFRPSVNVLGQSNNITSTTYVDSGGPTLADITAGTYLFLYGFQYAINGGTNPAFALASPSVNGDTPSDGDAVRTGYLLGSAAPSESDAERTEGSSIYFKLHTFSGPSNTVTMKYRVTDGNVVFTNMYLIAIKVSN